MRQILEFTSGTLSKGIARFSQFLDLEQTSQTSYSLTLRSITLRVPKTCVYGVEFGRGVFSLHGQLPALRVAHGGSAMARGNPLGVFCSPVPGRQLASAINLPCVLAIAHVPGVPGCANQNCHRGCAGPSWSVGQVALEIYRK